MSIERKHYVAAPADIEHLAKSIFEADGAALSGRRTYLSALVGTLQNELGSPPRQRNGSASSLDDAELDVHLKTFEDVAKRFGDAVSKAAKALNPSQAEFVSMTAFARSAASTLRSFIRARRDVRSLAAGKVTKAALAVPVTRRIPKGPVIRKRVSKLQEDLLGAAKILIDSDQGAAREMLEPLIGQLAQMLGLTDKPTRDPDVAKADGRPWQTKAGMFVPVTLQ